MKPLPNLVIIIASLGSGGAERVATTLANRFSDGQDGCTPRFKVTIVCLSAEEPSSYELSPQVNVVYLDRLSRPGSTFSAITNNIERVVALRRAVKGANADIVISFMLETNVLAVQARLGVPLIACEHTDPGFIQHKLAWRLLRRISYRFVDRLVVLNDYMKDWFAANGCRGITVIPNPVSIHPDPNARPGVPQPFVLAMGRLIESKRFDLLIELYAQMAQDYPEWRLVIAGDGEQKSRLENQIRELGMSDCIHLIGNTTSPHDWMQHAEIFVSTSTIEAFPMAICEAMMSGLPVVVMAYNEGVHALIPAQAGYVVEGDDTEAAFKEALKAMMGNPQARAEMGRAATRTMDHFAIAAVSRQWASLFSELGVSGRLSFEERETK